MITYVSIKKKTAGDTIVFSFNGQLDTTNCDAAFAPLYEALKNPEYARLGMDCKKLEYLNSMSIGYVIDVHLKCESSGKRFFLFWAEEAAKDTLELSGAKEIITMAKTEAEAIQLLNEGRA